MSRFRWGSLYNSSQLSGGGCFCKELPGLWGEVYGSVSEKKILLRLKLLHKWKMIIVYIL